MRSDAQHCLGRFELAWHKELKKSDKTAPEDLQIWASSLSWQMLDAQTTARHSSIFFWINFLQQNSFPRGAVLPCNGLYRLAEIKCVRLDLSVKPAFLYGNVEFRGFLSISKNRAGRHGQSNYWHVSLLQPLRNVPKYLPVQLTCHRSTVYWFWRLPDSCLTPHKIDKRLTFLTRREVHFHRRFSLRRQAIFAHCPASDFSRSLALFISPAPCLSICFSFSLPES